MKQNTMKRLLTLLLVGLCVLTGIAQNRDALGLLKTDPRRAYGTDYPYDLTVKVQTKAPQGYEPFYISHYGRHGSRYYWMEKLYKDLDDLLTTAHNRHQLTAEGEAFYNRFTAAKAELFAGATELSDLGWEQHQGIARTMYNSFPEVFKRGGKVMAVSSLSGRCVISMAAFCLALTQCNPNIIIREQSSRSTLDGVVPSDRQNPLRRKFPKSKARYESHRDQFKHLPSLHEKIVSRVFTSTDSLKGNIFSIASNLTTLYTSLPNIGHEGMMGNIVTDEEIAARWEESNLGSYSWVFNARYEAIPILNDILNKAEAAVTGKNDRLADLRFGHDNCLGPLTALMGINGADKDPEDPYEVKNCYQSWETCMASNLQLVFYRSKKSSDILVKCLLNGEEATLPIPTKNAPYYRWSDLRDYYRKLYNNI